MKRCVVLFIACFLFFSCQQKDRKLVEEESFFACACSKNTNIMAGSKGSLFKNASNTLVWEKIDAGIDRDIVGLFYDGISFYAAGHNGTVLISDNDGTTWQTKNAGSNFHLFAISSNNNKIAAVGHRNVFLISDDRGQTWQNRYSVANTQAALYDVAFGKGKFVAVGNYGTILIMDSIDNSVSSISIPNGTKKRLKGVVFDYVTNRWLTVGHEGVVFISEDEGQTWKEKVSGTKEDLLSVAFNGKRFLAVGSNGIILTSKDGSVWHKVENASSGTFRSVSCTNEKWLVITISGEKKIIKDDELDR